jgi:hypothetical protein
MRRRRADRCLLRALAALDAGVPGHAAAVVEEARALCPEHPELADVVARLQSSAPFPQQPVTVVSRRRLLCGAAALFVMLSAAPGCDGGWLWAAHVLGVGMAATIGR